MADVVIQVTPPAGPSVLIAAESEAGQTVVAPDPPPSPSLIGVTANIGVPGAPGEARPPHIHTQEIPSSIWTIIHNRDHLADVKVYDGDGDQIIGDINHDTENIATITFSAPVSGMARID